MPPKSFYDLDSSKYLFDKKDTPEERVRQWAIFELLSTYGVHINNIQVEKPAKIGSKWYIADIVILKDQIPYIVIECKNQDEENIDEGLLQAQSYARFFGAQFVVFTNGVVWKVQRWIFNDWVAVPDIAMYQDNLEAGELQDLFRLVDNLKPILYWLNQPVPPEQARKFLFALKLLLYNLEFFEGIDHNLHNGTAWLTNHIASYSENFFDRDKNVFDSEEDFIVSSVNSAFEEYFKKIEFQPSLPHGSKADTLPTLIFQLDVDFRDLAHNCRGLNYLEIFFIRFTIALLDYFHTIMQEKQFTEIPQIVLNELVATIDIICKIKHNFQIPDQLLDAPDILKKRCEDGWETFDISSYDLDLDDFHIEGL